MGAAEGKRVAFVVGVGAYDNLPPHQQLNNATNDADGVSEKLKENGFDVISGRNSRRTEFNTAWQNVLDKVSNDDVFLFFFSGHGIQIDGQNYLLPRDIPYIQFGRQAKLTREAISLDDLLSDLRTGDVPIRNMLSSYWMRVGIILLSRPRLQRTRKSWGACEDTGYGRNLCHLFGIGQ